MSNAAAAASAAPAMASVRIHYALHHSPSQPFTLLYAFLQLFHTAEGEKK